MFGCFEIVPGRFSFFYFRNDDLIAHSHSHRINGGTRGGRKNIRRIDWPQTFISISLQNLHIRDHTGDRYIHMRIFEGQVIYVGVPFHDEVRRQRFIVLSLRKSGRANYCYRYQQKAEITRVERDYLCLHKHQLQIGC